MYGLVSWNIVWIDEESLHLIEDEGSSTEAPNNNASDQTFVIGEPLQILKCNMTNVICRKNGFQNWLKIHKIIITNNQASRTLTKWLDSTIWNFNIFMQNLHLELWLCVRLDTYCPRLKLVEGSYFNKETVCKTKQNAAMSIHARCQLKRLAHRATLK